MQPTQRKIGTITIQIYQEPSGLGLEQQDIVTRGSIHFDDNLTMDALRKDQKIRILHVVRRILELGDPYGVKEL